MLIDFNRFMWGTNLGLWRRSLCILSIPTGEENEAGFPFMLLNVYICVYMYIFLCIFYCSFLMHMVEIVFHFFYYYYYCLLWICFILTYVCIFSCTYVCVFCCFLCTVISILLIWSCLVCFVVHKNHILMMGWYILF